MQAILLEGPREEPMNIDEVKAHLRLTGNHEDGLLGLYIQMSRTSLEEYIQQSFLTQMWKASFSPLDRQRIHKNKTFYYRLPHSPIQKILSVEERDGQGKTTKSLPLSQVELFPPDHISVKGSFSESSFLEVTYLAGLSETKEKLSPALRYALLLSVAQLYEQRSWENVREDVRIRKILAPYKTWRL